MLKRPLKGLNICITGDLLRPLEDGSNLSRQNNNIRRMYEILKYPIKSCGNNISLNVVYGQPGDFDVWDAYHSLNLETSIQSWIKSFKIAELPDPFIEQFNLTFSGYDCIICFEASNLMKRVFEKLNLTYIDIQIHPVRFLDDVMFSFYTNNDEMHEYFIDHMVPESLFYREAGFIASGCVGKKLQMPDDIQTVLFGQTDDDKVLMQNGTLVNFSSYRKEIKHITASQKLIGFKPHPYASSNFGILEIDQPLSGIHFVTDNFYHLACSDQIENIISITSSVSIEAKYFGKEAIHLGTYPWKFRGSNETSRDAYVPLRHECFFSEFWLGLLYTSCKQYPPTGFIGPNKIRLAFVNFWGFNEISSDFIVNLANK